MNNNNSYRANSNANMNYINPRISANGSVSSNSNNNNSVQLSTTSTPSNNLSYRASPPKTSSYIRQERQTNFKVVIRVRPPLPRETSGDEPFQNIVAVDEREQVITVSENLDAVLDQDGQVIANPGPYTTHTFVFDYVYDQHATQKKVYETTARPVVDSALQGYNATIFAYGQTGTGKTFTMEGFNREGSIEARGIIPRAIEQIFGHIQRHASPRMRFLVRASYLQIYNEQISDLLKPERNNLIIREDKKRGVFVDGLSEWVVRSPAEIYGLMERGGAVRATGETKMNEASSRSHAVFIVIAEQSETVYADDQGVELTPEEFQKFMHARGVHREQEMNRLEDHVRQSFKVGKLNLVDLAGSERVRLSGATGQRLEESKQINKSLSCLGNVISALTDTKSRPHIPYRDSKLTRMLEDSLGGNCKTTMMAMISPAFEAMMETVSTLKFANRAKNIRNEARVNEDLDQKSLLRKYERELKKLRAELEERNRNVVDKRRLLELDEQRKRAEADKMAAIRALEARSLEFMKEKEEKKKLEQRIAMLMGQMIRGEKVSHPNSNETNGMESSGDPLVKGGSHPSGGDNATGQTELHDMMKEQQDNLRTEYEFKLADLERERETIEEEKAQVDRYKQLLLKQRDIMIALTQRLVERDEQIMALQDELDAYDRHHKDLEEKLDEKTAMLIKFQRISMEVNATSPYKSEELNKALVDSWSHSDHGRPTGVATELVVTEDDEVSSFTNKESEDKIKGLNMIVGNQRSHISTLESQLAEMNSRFQQQQLRGTTSMPTNDTNQHQQLEGILKSELDFHLRRMQSDPNKQGLKGPLQTIVQQMIEKLKESSASNSTKNLDSSDYLKENQRLREEIQRLSNAYRQLEANSNSEGDVLSLQSKCETLVKEREAVQTIMEHKIKVLVQSVSQAAQSVLSTLSSDGSFPNNIVDAQAVQALSKDISALQRLVNASIAALKNAAATSSSTVTSNGNNHSTNTSNSLNSNSLNSNGSYMGNNLPNSYSTIPHGKQQPANSDFTNRNMAVGGQSSNMPAIALPSPSRSAPDIPMSNVMSSYPQQSNYFQNNTGSNGINSNSTWGAKDNSYHPGDVFKKYS